jgi:hypothetical protein
LDAASACAEGVNKQMRQEIAQLWQEALVSKEYKQIRGQLKGPHGFCCLGVLSDLYIKHNPQANVRWTDANEFRQDNGHTRKLTLPKEVQEWAGMRSEDGEYMERAGNGTKENKSLAQNNDSGMTFEQISEIIGHVWKVL